VDQIDAQIDALVAAVNVSFREPKDPRFVPEHLQDGGVDGLCFWRIMPLRGEPWVNEVEARLPAPLPASYRSLIARYEFPFFEMGPVDLFANSADGGPLELRTAPFVNPGLAELLHESKMIFIGRTIGGHLDPICFDGRRGPTSGELPIVRVDHQAAVERGELVIVSPIAPSFMAMVSLLL
jgi:hypothetical protein